MITQHRKLTREQIRDRWDHYVEHHDQADRDFLIEYYLPFVKSVAKRMEAKLRGHVELDDLISSGVLGLIKAVDTFDPARGVAFETFCAYRVRGAILDEVRAMDLLPRRARARSRELAEAHETLSSQLGCKPTDRELAAHLKVTLQTLQNTQRDDSAGKRVSLTVLRSKESGDFENDSEIESIRDKTREDVADQTMRTELKEFILEGLSRVQQLIVKMHYYEQMPMSEVGKSLDLSECSVSQIHKSVIARLRGRVAREGSKLRLTDGTWPLGNVASESLAAHHRRAA